METIVPNYKFFGLKAVVAAIADRTALAGFASAKGDFLSVFRDVIDRFDAGSVVGTVAKRLL